MPGWGRRLAPSAAVRHAPRTGGAARLTVVRHGLDHGPADDPATGQGRQQRARWRISDGMF